MTMMRGSKLLSTRRGHIVAGLHRTRWTFQRSPIPHSAAPTGRHTFLAPVRRQWCLLRALRGCSVLRMVWSSGRCHGQLSIHHACMYPYGDDDSPSIALEATTLMWQGLGQEMVITAQIASVSGASGDQRLLDARAVQLDVFYSDPIVSFQYTCSCLSGSSAIVRKPYRVSKSMARCTECLRQPG